MQAETFLRPGNFFKTFFFSRTMQNVAKEQDVLRGGKFDFSKIILSI